MNELQLISDCVWVLMSSPWVINRVFETIENHRELLLGNMFHFGNSLRRARARAYVLI